MDEDSAHRVQRTKVVATLGPASQTDEVLRAMIRQGADVVRMNFSHGTHDEHRHRVAKVRAIADEEQRNVGILGDLQGPKIRIERFADDEVILVEGRPFTLDATLDRDAGDATRVGVSYKALAQDVSAGDILLL
ncbi:MAG: pyruvate kinase, partial [Proteobacteria bacterium SW_6_67_9]